MCSLLAAGSRLQRLRRLPWYDTPLDGSKITVHDVVNTCKQKVQNQCDQSVGRANARSRQQNPLGICVSSTEMHCQFCASPLQKIPFAMPWRC
eukprot:365157-Amphidinium_carterae.1